MVRNADIALRWRAAWISVSFGLVMLALKGGAWLLTGSVAILSDALESVVHVGATLGVVYALRLTLTPPDPLHPYGHGKAEHFSVGFEGGLVFLAGLAVLVSAAWSAWRGEAPQALGLGLAAVATAMAVNGLLGWWLIRTGRRTSSRILVADGQHVLTDAWTSLGVLVGVAVVWMTDIWWLDPLTAALVGVHILLQGGSLVRQAVGGLMDQADPGLLAEVVETINDQRCREWHDVHGLRAQRNADSAHVDLHLVVPADWTVGRAHGVVKALEQAILARLACEGDVNIHLDTPEQHGGVSYPCPQGGPFTLAAATRIAVADAPSRFPATR